MFIKTLQKLSIACVSALLALCLSTAAFGQQFKQFALPEPPREKGTSDVLELICAPMESVRIGIVGLGAAIDFINTYGIDKIREQEMNLIEIFYKKIQKIQGIKIYHEKQLDLTKQTAICSINLEEYDSGSVSDELMERFQIQTRSGAHCAPLVHEHFGTIEQGMVRFSFGHETTMKEINQIINAVKILAEE